MADLPMIELPRTPSQGDDIPKELPVYQLEALSPHIQKIFHDAWLSLYIKHCEVCGRTTEEYKVKTCSWCGFTRVNRVFYCSRTCQKRGWEKHKLECRADTQAPPDFGFPRTRHYNARRRAERAMWSWLEALRPIFEWATTQAYRISIAGEPRRTCLQFNLSTPERQTVYTPFILRSITFRPIKPGIDHHIRASDSSAVGYTVLLNERRRMTGAIRVIPYNILSPGDEIDVPTGLWPWLLAETVHLKPDGPEVAKVLLRLLFTSVVRYKKENPTGTLFAPFRPPRIGAEWKMQRFDDWHHFMRHVIPWWTREPEVDGEEPQWQVIPRSLSDPTLM